MDIPAKVVKVRLKHNRKFAEWIHLVNHTSRHVYNRAVSTCLFGGGYLDRVVVDLPDSPEYFRLPSGGDGVAAGTLLDGDLPDDPSGFGLPRGGYGVIGGTILGLDGTYQAYGFGPSEKMMKYGLFKELTAWRAQLDWLRDLPVAFGRGAILDASVACRRVIEDCSDRSPYRPKDGRIILSSVEPPAKKGERLIFVPGYGMVETVTPVDPAWDMRSFRIVDVTDKITMRTAPSDRKFELHVAIWVEVEQRRPTGVIRGVDVGGRHMAVTVDTAGKVAVHDVAHRHLLFEIRALKSMRDRHHKGGRRWSKVNKKIRHLQAKANRVADNSVNQAVAATTRGADKVVVEGVSTKGMTAHGGSRKRGMNRSMAESRQGEFLMKVEQKCVLEGRGLDRAPPAYTSQTCHVCQHVDSRSRVSRGRFVCVKCYREFHADVNAAWNILCWAAGIVVLRRLEAWWGDKPKPRPLPAIMVAEASRKGNGYASTVYYCI